MKFYVSVIALLLLITSCKKEQPELTPVNEDCDCAAEVSADFFMLEMTVGNENLAEYTDTDSILGSKNVHFRAKESGAEYTWYIGSEVLHDSSVTRFFGSPTIGQTVPITLVVRKKPNTICFPLDDGYDSIVKDLSITNFPISDFGNSQFYLGSIEGTYRVKSNHLADSFDITVDAVYNGMNQQRLNVTNYDGQGTDCLLEIQMNDGYNYRELFLTGGTATTVCDYLRGRIKNPVSGQAQMDFTFYYEGHPDYALRQYLGRKLN